MPMDQINGRQIPAAETGPGYIMQKMKAEFPVTRGRDLPLKETTNRQL
jgi:hypothetical protein